MEVNARYADILKALLSSIREEYGDTLVSVVVFGSVARGVATPESDIDVLIIAEDLPKGRMNRIPAFERIEQRISTGSESNTRFELSPIIKTPDEVKLGSPLFWDMTEEAMILHDRDGFFKNYLDELRKRLSALGARRVVKGNAWYWILKEDFTPGEVFEI